MEDNPACFYTDQRFNRRGRLIMWEREEGMARMMFLSSLKRMGSNPQVHSWPLSGHGKLILSCKRKGSTDVHRFRWVGMGNKVFS